MGFAKKRHGVWGKLLFLFSKQEDTRASLDALCNDVLINILSRLPVQSVLACKLVCQQWYTLVKTAHFVEAHRKRAIGGATIALISEEQWPLIIIDDHQKAGKKVMKRLRIAYTQIDHQLVASCDGMLVTQDNRLVKVRIENPITKVAVELGRRKISGPCCGFYFDELMNEYKLILYRLKRKRAVYITYGLRTKLSKVIGSSPLKPKRLCPSLTLQNNKVVCWKVSRGVEADLDLMKDNHKCSECIMIFMVDTQKLRVIPHPGKTCSRWDISGFHKMNLFEMENCVAFAEARPVVNIWVLKDLAKFTWVLRHVVNPKAGFKNHSKSVLLHRSNDEHAQVLNILDRQLLLHWPKKGWFLYDSLCQKVISNFRVKGPRDRITNYSAAKTLNLKLTFVSPKLILG